MGFGRKVGAFLGLVADEGQQFEDGHEHADAGFDGPDYRQVRPLDERRPAYAGSRPYADGRSHSDDTVVHGALAVKPAAAPRRDAVETPAPRPATVKLSGFADGRIIGEKYRDGQSVILDMTDMSDPDARRLVDFSAGLAFSLHGSIEKVAPKVFMLLPAEAVEQSSLGEHLLQDARMYAGR